MTQINNEKFGEFILELRKEKGLTQKQLAKEILPIGNIFFVQRI